MWQFVLSDVAINRRLGESITLPTTLIETNRIYLAKTFLYKYHLSLVTKGYLINFYSPEHSQFKLKFKK